jgi:hypothetical protein
MSLTFNLRVIVSEEEKKNFTAFFRELIIYDYKDKNKLHAAYRKEI